MGNALDRFGEFKRGDYVELVTKSGTSIRGTIDDAKSREIVIQSGTNRFKTTVKQRDIATCKMAVQDSSEDSQGVIAPDYADNETHGRITEYHSDTGVGWITCDNGEKIGFSINDCDQEARSYISTDYRNLGTYVRVSFVKDKRRNVRTGGYRPVAKLITLDEDFRATIVRDGDVEELEFSKRADEIIGEICLYKDVRNFGVIHSVDGAEYQFMKRSGDAPFRKMLDYFRYNEIIGIKVAFLPKERKNLKGEIRPIADDIRLVDKESIDKANMLATENAEDTTWDPPSPDEVIYGHINYYDLERRECIVGGDDSRSYHFNISNREKILKKFILDNSSEDVIGTRVSFVPIGKPDEDVREKGYGSKLRILPEEDDPLVSYAKQALDILVSEGDENAQRQVLEAADKLYVSGKRFSEGVITLYQRLLDSGYRSTAVLNRLVSLYGKAGQTGAILELLHDKESWFESKEKYLDTLLDAYKRQGLLVEALEVEMELLECINKPSKKLSLTFSVAQTLFSLGQYEESLKYCSDWLAIKNGPNKKLFMKRIASISLTEKNVCILAANCISLLGHNSKPSITPILEEYEEVKEILNGSITSSPDYHPEEGLRKNLTVVSQALIQSADPQEAGVDIRRFDPSGQYLGSVAEAKSDAGYLAKIVTNQRPHLRYRTCFAAAKLLMEALEKQDEDDPECEKLLYDNLVSALVSRADTLVKDEGVDICVARYMYLEALRYVNIGNQDCVNATVRCVLSTFSERFDIPISMKGDSNNSLSFVSDGLSRAESVSKDDLLNVLTRVYRNSLQEYRRKALERLCGEVCKSNKAEEIGQFIAKKAHSAPSLNLTSQQGLAQAVQDYYGKVYIVQERQWAASARRLSEIEISPMGFKEAIEILARASFFEEQIDSYERLRFSSLRRIIDGITDYFGQSSFRNKEAKLKGILGQTNSFIESVSSGPTEYSFEFLLPIVKKWNAAFTQMLDELYAASRPQLRCMAVQSQVNLDDDNRASIQLDITNAPEAQTADSVSIRIRKSSEYVVETVPDRSPYIYGGEGETVSVTLRVNDSSIKAIALAVDIDCTSLEDSRTMCHQTFEDNVSIILGHEEFHLLDNPYAAYVKSGVVTDEEMVFGRTQFIKEVIDSIRGADGHPLRRKTIALYGQKRTGKSTILYHLGRRLAKGSPTTVVISLGDISKWAKRSFERKLYREFFKRLNKELASTHQELLEALTERGVEIPSYRDIVDDIQGRDAFGDFMDEFNELIEEDESFSNYNIVLLLDEFTNIYMYLCRGQIDRDFMQYWKAITNDYGLVGIVVGQDYMPDFVSSYPNPFGAIDARLVTYLPEAEAKRMITAPRASSASNFAVFNGSSGERAIKRILELTACSAFFLMIFMDKLIRYLNNCKRAYVTDADVKTILQDDLLAGNGSLRKDDFESLYYDDSDIADPSRPRDNMMVLWLLARRAKALGHCRQSDITSCPELALKAISEKRVAYLLNRLVDRGVLTHDANGNYAIRVGLFQEWLCASCGLDVVESIKDVQA